MIKLTAQQQKTYNLIEKTLRKRKVRLTDIRLAIIKEIIASDHPTPATIVKSLEVDYGNVNVTSVYNTLDLLLDEHIVSANTFDGKQISYEIILTNTVHFTCSVCHKVYHVDSGEYDDQLFEILNKLGAKISFEVDHYKIEVHGTCQQHTKNS